MVYVTNSSVISLGEELNTMWLAIEYVLEEQAQGWVYKLGTGGHTQDCDSQPRIAKTALAQLHAE
jgi:hypothetical protein